MKTIILDEPGRFRAAETKQPAAPGPGEALVRVHRVGVCGTDLHAYRGDQPFFTYPRILGHELGVEVVRIGEGVENVGAGERCAVEPYLNCGDCIACRAGKTNCCVDLKVLGVHTDGGMREQIVVPARKLHRSEKLSLDQLTLVETLGIGAHAVQRGVVQGGENALVIGAGPIGLSVMQFARAAGANVIAMDVNPARLEFARSQMGVDRLVDARNEPLEQAAEMTSGDLPTVVFDATGSPQSMMQSFQFVAHGGRLVFVGLFQGDVTFHDPLFHRREMTILSSRNSTAADFRHIIKLMEEGKIDTTPWITHRATLDTMIPQFEGWLDPANRVLKAMIEV